MGTFLGPMGPYGSLGRWAHGPRVLGPLFFAGLAYFSPDLRVFATSAAPPATTHPSIKEVAFGPPLWIPLWMGVWWLGGEQTWQKHASPAKNEQVRRKIRGQGRPIPSKAETFSKIMIFQEVSIKNRRRVN